MCPPSRRGPGACLLLISLASSFAVMPALALPSVTFISFSGNFCHFQFSRFLLLPQPSPHPPRTPSPSQLSFSKMLYFPPYLVHCDLTGWLKQPTGDRNMSWFSTDIYRYIYIFFEWGICNNLCCLAKRLTIFYLRINLPK